MTLIERRVLIRKDATTCRQFNLLKIGNIQDYIITQNLFHSAVTQMLLLLEHLIAFCSAVDKDFLQHKQNIRLTVFRLNKRT